MIVGSNILAGASGQGGNYLLNRSVRLRSSATAYFNRTPASASNRKIWTWSGWVKRGILGSGSEQALFTAGNQPANTYDTFTWLADLIRFTVINAAAQRILVTTQSVFRDPSAWYHVVIAIDTTQAVSTNGVRIWVNNVLQPLTVTAYTQNQDCTINSTSPHYLGVLGGYAPSYFDGYLTEVNFIDGQALTPTSFGEYNTITGVWQPKKYVGTYGTNGFYLPFNLQNTSSYAASFNGSSQYVYLNNPTALTLGSNSFTIESWVYLNSASQTGVFYDGRPSGTQGAYPVLYFAAGVLTYYVNSNALISGTSPSINQWHHVAVVRNGTTTTMYLDGVSQGSATDTTNYLSGGATRPIIGMTSNVGAYFNGLLSNFRVVNGSAVYTSNFVPSSVPLTAITNTALLTFQNATIVDNSTNAYTITNVGSVTTSLATPFVSSIGSDASGNNNNWFANNINVATLGTTFDSMTDVPTLTSATTANYSTLNPLNIFAVNIAAGSVSNGNLRTQSAASANAYQYLGSTISAQSGTYYFEATLSQVAGSIYPTAAVGWAINNTSSALPSTYVQVQLYTGSGSTILVNGATVQSGLATITNADIIGVAFDATNLTCQFYKNGATLGTQVTGLTSGSYQAIVTPISNGSASTSIIDVNFGQRPFTYTPPTGFKALNTYNLPTPTIKNGAEQFAATTYTGTGSAMTVTNTVNSISLQPDFLWIKQRNSAANHVLADSIRGVNKYIFSNLTNAEATATAGTGITAFNSNGFSLGTETSTVGSVNAAGGTGTYVAWQWKASNAAAVTNTSGSITSSVSANPSAGFSIVTFTCPASGNFTVGHGLGIAPAMFILKTKNGVDGWYVYHKNLATPASNYLVLNTTAATATSTSIWGNTNPTSSVLTLGTNAGIAAGATGLLYCFSEIAGYSKFGSYTGNGSADGPFVYCGFRPRWVMVKSTGIDGWVILDTSRDTYNLSLAQLIPNLSNAEDTTNNYFRCDILSNGFKLRTTGTPSNANGVSFIYAAFAESPFSYSLAR